MGKGSKRRPRAEDITEEQYKESYKRIFPRFTKEMLEDFVVESNIGRENFTYGNTQELGKG